MRISDWSSDVCSSDRKSRTPVNSILFCGVFSMGLAVSHGFVWLVTLSTFVRLLSYALCIASPPKIEKTIATEAGQFQLRGGLIIPGIDRKSTRLNYSH